jgi:hypothetical protein
VGIIYTKVQFAEEQWESIFGRPKEAEKYAVLRRQVKSGG